MGWWRSQHLNYNIERGNTGHNLIGLDITLDELRGRHGDNTTPAFQGYKRRGSLGSINIAVNIISHVRPKKKFG